MVSLGSKADSALAASTVTMQMPEHASPYTSEQNLVQDKQCDNNVLSSTAKSITNDNASVLAHDLVENAAVRCTVLVVSNKLDMRVELVVIKMVLIHEKSCSTREGSTWTKSSTGGGKLMWSSLKNDRSMSAHALDCKTDDIPNLIRCNANGGTSGFANSLEKIARPKLTVCITKGSALSREGTHSIKRRPA